MSPAALLLSVCFAQPVHQAYAAMDTVALVRLYSAAPTREDSLLARFRLYALTRERQWIAGLPGGLRDGSAREYALLSALWAYHIPGSAPWNVIRYGRRSAGLLDEALRRGPRDQLVVLIDGQSLLFRPGIAGGDVRRGIARLRQLAAAADADACGVTRLEAEAWLWFGLARAGTDEAPALRRRLLATSPPPLYARFLDATGAEGMVP